LGGTSAANVYPHLWHFQSVILHHRTLDMSVR